MREKMELPDGVRDAAALLASEWSELPDKGAKSFHAFRRRISGDLRERGSGFMLDPALELKRRQGLGGMANQLLNHHRNAFAELGRAELEQLGDGLDSWWTVDSFGRLLGGPAWLAGQISDETVMDWAHSDDLWWRRAALVCTLALNARSKGGYGDTRRTLMVCGELVADHEDMVVKAMSWALRELVWHDPEAVRGFLEKHGAALAARVKREVRNKLSTGLKNPGRRGARRTTD